MKNKSSTKDDSTQKKWGDSEHDTVVHSNQKPHTGKSEYDQKYHQYRTNGG